MFCKITMTYQELKYKIIHKWAKLRLAPIRVFCFHQTSAVFDSSTMKEGDWTEIEQFKRNIAVLQQEYQFISLPEVNEKMKQHFRRQKYACLTSDDGWASLKEILPWLNEQHIPITLFLNPGYFDGQHFRERDTEKYLSLAEVEEICSKYPLVTIGLHGWEHWDSSKQTIAEFADSVERSVNALKHIPNYIPYFAFTWDRKSWGNYMVLYAYHIIPVVVRGNYNYNTPGYIDREPFDNIKLD